MISLGSAIRNGWRARRDEDPLLSALDRRTRNLR
jgi:hypothetical protein